MALRSNLGLAEPHLLEMQPRRMAVVTAYGDPEKVAEKVVGSLYAAVQAAQAQFPFEIEPLRARWPVDDDDVPRSEWLSTWALPVPNEIVELPQFDAEHEVKLDDWEYGPVAEILHEGSYAEEGRAVEKLLTFIGDHNLEVCGPHEEEYLTPPTSSVPRHLIRFQVCPLPK